MPTAPHSSQRLLTVQNLTKRFPGVIALKNVSFDLNEGEVHALCGENGAGKSTLIKTLSGIHPFGSYEGTIQLHDRAAEFRSIADAEKAGIAVIYQELALIREMTVAENIFLGAEPTKGIRIDWNRLYADTKKLMAENGLNLDPATRVGDLGIGQQQMVEILKALSKRSKILLLDEPTAALTEKEVEILLGIIRGLKEKGLTCVYISHKLDEVFAIADRITVLRDGESVGTFGRVQTNKSEVIRHMVGREIRDLFPRRQAHLGATLLKVENLRVREPGKSKPVLEGISFELRAGEVLGFGGLMGAGRTELLMHIFGVYGRRLAGKILIAGKELFSRSPAEAIAQGLVLVSEDRKRYGLLLKKSIGFNLSLAALKQFSRNGLIDHPREIKSNQTYFDSLGIKAPGQETFVETLSGGNQQKVVLGKALMTKPSVVFLDEPTRGIDVGAKIEVYEIINQLTEQGKAVILVSSELPELMSMSDRIIILSNGRIGGTFTREEATQEGILTAAMKFH
ncbi:sugar ABC transporter ATP-binding protein [candidate division KSB1 bacterium]|nr:sugar ABC transporter ATP-binding protein [candidate division KSB1 bacterium]